MRIITNDQKINELLTRGVENVYPNRKFLEDKLKAGIPLKLYLGIDPTGSTLHLGHAISLMKLRQFQELGHKIIMLIGSFTAMIGDPTDKLATRKPLTREQVLKNCENYRKQASVIIKFDGENPAELKFNDEWLDKLTFRDAIKIAEHLTVPRLLERDMFQKRMQEGKTIGLHEFLYPLLQGFDSVAMDVDGELGGNDQTFNMLVGRDLLKAIKGKEKFVLTNKLLTDNAGKKMGKTEGNMITLDDSAEEKFGKVMAWTDDMIVNGFELCTFESMDVVKQAEQRLKKGENPRDLKLELAESIVKIYHGGKAAAQAKGKFVKMFSEKETPEEMPAFALAGKTIGAALVASGLVKSKSEARRNIVQKGVSINGQVVDSEEILVKKGDVVKKGKRFFIRII
ncbi:tyrosine--tRNA ligase [Candidatus Falkowbacteria bacterium]|nr:tyrosine--tRNA ligase [Candidatus Falkowbacteria bacterium]